MRWRVAAALPVVFVAGAASTVERSTAPVADADGDGVTDDEDAYLANAAYSVPLTVTVRCYDLDGALATSPAGTGEFWDMSFVIDRALRDFSEPWATPFPPEASVACNVVGEDGWEVYVEDPVTDVEQADWDATDPQYREYTIGINYANCVEHGTLWITQEWPVSVEQASEAVSMFEYCPDHPDRSAIEDRIGALGVEQAERDGGVRFGPGLLHVGDDVQPGTYVAESDDGFEWCYWERQDSNGEIIDNFFGQVFRTEVTIAATDFAFRSEGCGEWQLLE